MSVPQPAGIATPVSSATMLAAASPMTIVRLTDDADIYGADQISDTRIYAGAGDDRIGTCGIDNEVYAGAGDDRLFIYYDVAAAQTGNLYNGGGGRDLIEYEVLSEVYRGVEINLDKKVAFKPEYPQYRDKIIGFEDANGSYGNDRVIGSAVANTLSGGEGNDVVKGLGGNDVLYGDTIGQALADGNDRLFGGTGNDILIGQGGADVLQGDSGADTFRYLDASDSRLALRDTIKDFSARQGDIIDLRAIDANETARGNQVFRFIGDDTFSGRAGELCFRRGLLSGDTDGDGVADFQVKLIGVATLLRDDLLL